RRDRAARRGPGRRLLRLQRPGQPARAGPAPGGRAHLHPAAPVRAGGDARAHDRGHGARLRATRRGPARPRPLMKLFSLPLEGGGPGRGCCSARLLATLILTLPLAACSLLGPAPGAFVTAAAVPATAAGGAAVLLPDGRVAAVGASGLAIYDPLADRWQARAGPPGGGFPFGL